MRKPLNKKVAGDLPVAGGILVLPFLLFYWMVPFVAGLTLGTDYVNYHIFHHLDLLFSIKTGSFPLYAPACYYGQSAVYPYAQLYHPVSYVVSLLPGFWQGYSLEWLTLYRLLSLAVCHLFLYLFLKKLGLRSPAAFLISLITVYNLRMVALFWNVVALDAYTGMLFLCLAAGWYYLEPERRGGPLLIILAFYWLINSDFPPYVFYGLVGAVIFIMTLPFLAGAVSGRAPERERLYSYWWKTAACFAVGLLLSSAYLLPFFLDYLSHSSGRIDQPYLWATQWTDTLPGFFNNFFEPLGAGYSMFGGTPLFLVALLAPAAAALTRRKVPGVIWLLLGIIIICFFYMQGEKTPVHGWAWQYVPLASALRGPGRISMILPLLFMMILVWMAAGGCNRGAASGEASPSRPLLVAALAALVLTGVYACLPERLVANTHYSCPYNIRTIPDWIRPALIISSLIILVLVVVRFLRLPDFLRRRRNIAAGGLILVLTIFQLMIFFRHGPYAIEERQKTPTYEQILAQKRESINFQPVFFLNQHAGSLTVVRQLENYFMEVDLARIYRRYRVAADIEEVYRILNDDRTADEVVVERFQPPPADRIEDADCAGVPDRVELIYSSYNRLVFSARACRPSFFVLSYPRSENWQARLNDQATTIHGANGAAQAVYLPPGEHTLEFRYWSRAALAGMIISCLALALLGVWAGFRVFPGPAGHVMAAAALIAAVGIFWVWYAGLYAGDNLETSYTWQSPSPGAPVNLAFGKATRMSSHRPGYPLLYNSRLAVDGGRGIDSCFFTAEEERPWWMVDLGEAHEVGLVALFTGFQGEGFNTPPLTLSISKDGKYWQTAGIEEFDENGRAVLVFDPPRTLRYLNIRASGETTLSLNEVEIYQEPEPLNLN